MKNDDEMYKSLLSRFDDYQEKKKKNIRILCRLIPASACFSVVFLLLLNHQTNPVNQSVISSQPEIIQQLTTNSNYNNTKETVSNSTGISTRSYTKIATSSAINTTQKTRTDTTDITTQTSEDEKNISDIQDNTDSANQDDPVQNPPSQPDTDIPAVSPPVATEPSNSQGDVPETPNGVFTSLNVDYETARDKFAHPIIPCTSNDFINYKVGMVSQNGNTNSDRAFCLSVTYEFTNGSINMQDQDRLTGFVCPEGEEHVYCGKIFYVEEQYDMIHIGYYPTPESGIAYQAFFDPSTEIYEIMDKIISIEI